ncbi:cellulose-binding protein [Colletotrichum truncatum]|uniref:Cellulose-binding protein n=1 Tax=Colletotrichum truncatum TaxID=5467 RepID=A0ACC3Z2Q2_COLTU|nr:cellulose-binding protein [Colletotrichum truncatum]KAF6793307.1 cellulose-binding protein [Colletotrichum truncatum]
MKFQSALLLAGLASPWLVSAACKKCESARYKRRPRVFATTDISNEPDDQMSLVRFLTYSNEWNVQGISGATSQHLQDKVDSDTIHKVIDHYAKVVDNLNLHVPEYAQYPTPDELHNKTYRGHTVYGLKALEMENLSEAAEAFIAAVDKAEKADPVWFLCWGGCNILAESLHHVSKTRAKTEADSFVEKVRVYSISDQDDTGSWLREQYPKLFYIVALHAFGEYTVAAWNGISGELFRNYDIGGPPTELQTNEWLDEYIRIGELGKVYPQFLFTMEGDTPSFLGLIQNGLGDPNRPDWGGWGGRNKLVDRSGRSQVYSTVADYHPGADGRGYQSMFVPIWRWRRAFQHDFAARMQWTVNRNYTGANHNPVAVLNSTCGPEPFEVDYTFGNSVVLDASESWDPDNDELVFKWEHYREITMNLRRKIDPVSKNVTIEALNEKGSIVRVTPLADLDMHIILSVEDDRDMELTSYRRVILKRDQAAV